MWYGSGGFPMTNRERVIVALDLERGEEAVRVAKTISPVFPFFKIGIKLFTQSGPDLVREVLRYGRVFLDLKFYDIPSVVADAVEQAARLGVTLLTLHASGGSEMMKASVQKARNNGGGIRLLGVTVLTSFSTLSEFGIGSVQDHVRLLANLAQESGLDGIVCSPAELFELRSAFPAPFCIVTPGIRSSEDQKGDQKRTATAEAALDSGADFIVIGRPIVAAQDPVRAAETIAAAID
jgi:orotidine-5'-phosphate decarboxylase